MALTNGRAVLDMIGREMNGPLNPQRIISLVPSQTELLFDLALGDRIAGITWFCIHPEEGVKDKPKIGGTKNVNIEKVRALKPDLIIANKEENNREQIEALEAEFPVWVSDITTLEEACQMVRRVGEITSTQPKAEEIATGIEKTFSDLPKAPPLRTLYLIWREPWMTIGNDTFIHHILTRCGLVNACADKTRYPELSVADIQSLAPELLLLSSEPYPFKEKHIAQLAALLPTARIILVDGEMFSWYGSRLVKAGQYLENFVRSLM